MFQQLQVRFGEILRNVRGLGKITEKNIDETAREIRRALLEADVNYKVAKEFVDEVARKAVGSPVLESVVPGQQFVKILAGELARLLGEHREPLRFADRPPTVILMAGLQGSGKTTTAAKLANRLKNEGRKPFLVAADVYRPAAVEQLKILGHEIDVPVWTEPGRDPVNICANGLREGELEGCDVVILDTAGRLHVDAEMMEEIVEIAQVTKPNEVLFVADGMTGQDAVNSASAFSKALEITGSVLTKMDGDARGGAALSIRAATGKPIKFMGTDEKIDGLEPFHPERIASRILGMGDIVTLVERAEEVVDRRIQDEAVEKMQGNRFTLKDFQEQLRQVRKMGSLGELVGLIPGLAKSGKKVDFDEKQLVWTDAIINSMTPQERMDPSIIDGQRRRRIALGSGTSVQDVNRLLKEYAQLQRMMKGNFRKMGQILRAVN